ncbi:MAG: helicase-exonuclease AddAB subunit AddB [Syntrophomonadaceae bacterium]|jgi:ATP-dependent helicase/nuclease subunit B|nr:helicase-exonuclease AddAB subunit AddB [Syntrophomonadaceae bacterium]
MFCEYILGASFQSKTQYIIEQMENELKRDPLQPIILLVPEQFTLQAEQSLIKNLRRKGIINIEVLSPTRLAHRVMNQVGGITRTLLSEQGQTMILKKIVDDSLKQLSIYKNVSRQEGFIENMEKMVREFKQLGVSAGDLEELREKVSLSSHLRQKLADISVIYKNLNDFCGDKYLMNEDVFDVLIEKLPEWPELAKTKFWVHFVGVFSPQLVRIMEQIGLHAQSLSVSLHWRQDENSRDRSLFVLAEKVFLQLHDFAREHHIKEKITDADLLFERTAPPDIEHLRRELYAYPAQAWQEGVTNIECWEAGNIYKEIEKTALAIHALVYEKKWRWRDITVLSNDWENYQMMFEQIFCLYEIPFFFDNKRSIMNHPLIMLLLSTLDILNKGFNQENILGLVKTGLSPLSRDEWEKLENYAVKYGIKGKKWKKDFTKGEENHCLEMEALRLRLMEPLLVLEQRLETLHGSTEISRALYQYLQDLELRKKIEHDLNRFFAAGQFELLAESSQVWNILMDIFTQMCEFISDEELRLPKYQRILETGLKSYHLGVIPFTLDQVVIGDIKRTTKVNSKAVFIVGANDGIIPKNGTDEGLLSMKEIEILDEKGISLLSKEEYKDAEEDLLIYMAFAMADEFLHISCAGSDNEGRALRPSLLFHRLRQIFPSMVIENEFNSDMGIPWSSPGGVFNHLLKQLRENKKSENSENLWNKVNDWYNQQDKWENIISLTNKGLNYYNQQDLLRLPSGMKNDAKPLVVSASRLEKFAGCPFAYFVQYTLSPEPRKEYSLTAPDIGDFFHRGLFDFFQKAAFDQKDADLTQEQVRVLADQVLEEILQEYGERIFFSSGRYNYWGRRLKRIGMRAMETLWRQMVQGEFKPLALEAQFGRECLLPPLQIVMSGGKKLIIEGRIDRVDGWKNGGDFYVTVLDYKTGAKKFNLSEIYNGLNLQLIIYLQAVLLGAGAFGYDNPRPAGVFYFHIDDPFIESADLQAEVIAEERQKRLGLKGLVLDDEAAIRGLDRAITANSSVIPVSLNKDASVSKASSVLDENGWRQLIKHVEHTLQQTGERIEQGVIKIAPVKMKSQNACQYCAYASICRFDPALPENNYRLLNSYKKQAVIMNLSAAEGGAANDGLD